VLLLRASRRTDVIQILLGVRTEHLAFVTANGAFDHNFRTGSRRSIHIGWSHTVKLRAQSASCNMNRRRDTGLRLFSSKAFLGKNRPSGRFSDDRCAILRLPVK
jgi:hypothetical protein